MEAESSRMIPLKLASDLELNITVSLVFAFHLLSLW